MPIRSGMTAYANQGERIIFYPAIATITTADAAAIAIPASISI